MIWLSVHLILRFLEALRYIVWLLAGAMTVGGHEGCYFAEYGCPDHSLSLPKVGLIHHDAYAEQTLNALHNEHNCLSRAFPQYRYCGSHLDYPYTSIFLPTGIYLLLYTAWFYIYSSTIVVKEFNQIIWKMVLKFWL